MSKMKFVVAALLLALTLAGTSRAASPGLTVDGPKDGEVIRGTSVTVQFKVSDFKIVPSTLPVSEAGKRPDINRPGEGHLHFVLDLQPLVVWDRDAPYTFNDLPSGQHQLMVELANNDHASLSPPVMQTIRFETVMGLPATGTTPEPDWAMLWVVLGLGAGLVILGGMARRRRLKGHKAIPIRVEPGR